MLTTIIIPLLLMTQPAQAPTTYATPEAAIKAYRQAIDKGDVDLFAKLTSGPPGVALRTLTPALKKAQTASEAFSKALNDKPALSLVNPLADDFNPLNGYQFELIELTAGKDEHLARVRFGQAKRMIEETLSIRKEADTYRVSLPGVYLKAVQLLTPERMSKQVESLNTLAGILSSLADQINKGELTSKDAILLKLAQAVRDAKLSEIK